MQKEQRSLLHTFSSSTVAFLSVDVPVKLWPHISTVYCCWLYSLAASINIVPVTTAALFRGRIVICQLQYFAHLNPKRAFKLGRSEDTINIILPPVPFLRCRCSLRNVPLVRQALVTAWKPNGWLQLGTSIFLAMCWVATTCMYACMQWVNEVNQESNTGLRPGKYELTILRRLIPLLGIQCFLDI